MEELYVAQRYSLKHQHLVIVRNPFSQYIGDSDITYNAIENYYKWWASTGNDMDAVTFNEMTIPVNRARFVAGTVVVVTKLDDNPRMNGEIGTVTGYAAKSNKYKVYFEAKSLGLKLVKKTHLKIVS